MVYNERRNIAKIIGFINQKGGVGKNYFDY